MLDHSLMPWGFGFVRKLVFALSKYTDQFFSTAGVPAVQKGVLSAGDKGGFPCKIPL
jgi:hypothetical protein